MSDNGTSEGGGNGSVYWQVTHGPRTNGRTLNLANPLKVNVAPGGAATAVISAPSAGPPAHDHVKIADKVEGHDDVDFNDIGKPDHPGRFRVRLRFSTKYVNGLVGEQRALLEHARPITSMDPNSVFLFVDVPAVPRQFDVNTGTWNGGEWEIYWEW